MCFHSRQTQTALQLENRFDAKVKKGVIITPKEHVNGFGHPKTPIITNEKPKEIDLLEWGLIPNWAKDDSIQKYTLNARIETLSEKSSFKNVTQKRCLVLVDGFYEWQWLDKSGKKKQKYLITVPDDKPFAMAGLWSEWADPDTGEIRDTYTIITTEANKLMAEIHNHKKRMPIILKQEDENNWLNGQNYENFAFPYHAELVAKPVT